MSEQSKVKALTDSIVEFADGLADGGIDPVTADYIVRDFAHQMIEFDLGA